MINYEKKILKNQINMKKENEIRAWEVLYAVERQLQVRIINPKMSAIGNIINILTNPYYINYRDILIKTIELFAVEDKNIIQYLIAYYSQANPLKQKFLEQSYEKLPYFENLEKENGLNVWDTSQGIVIFKSFESQLNFQERKVYHQNNCYHNNSLNAVASFAPKYPNAYIKTVEIERLFGTPAFHAVLSSENNSTVYDIANNTIYKDNSYRVFNPQEIISIRCDDLESTDILKLSLSPKNTPKVNVANLKD